MATENGNIPLIKKIKQVKFISIFMAHLNLSKYENFFKSKLV
jgi:hypothetical protein